MIDCLIIGGGSAGYIAAIAAAQLNKKVVLVEEAKIGGTCLHHGCIPTKTLLHIASIYASQKQFANYGLSGTINYDATAMNDYKNSVVDKLANGIQQLLKAKNVEVIYGKAAIVDPQHVLVDDMLLEVNNILIASGAQTRTLPNTLSSDDILDFKDRGYKELIIIGGGVIGCELAQLYSLLGTKVTLLEAQSRLLMPFDKEVSQNLSLLFKKQNVTIHFNCENIKIDNNEVTFTTKDKEVHYKADAVLSAIGRVPRQINSLLEINYNLQDNGKTNFENIFVAGDCAYPMQLAHFAQASAINAIDLMFNQPLSKDLNLCPQVIYTSPEIATVGNIDSENSLIGRYTLNGHGYTLLKNQGRSFVKLVVDKEQHILLGATLMCDHASDIIQLLALAIKEKTPIEKLRELVYPHPSFVEAIDEAIMDINQQSLHTIYKKN